MKRTLLLTTALLLLSACGWHLRGVTPLPEGYRVLYIKGMENSALHQGLIEQLQFNGAVITARAADAPVIMTLSDYGVERRTLSVNSLGQVAEYEFNGRLTAHVDRIADDGHYEVTVTARRTLQNDVNNVVATQQEEQNVRAELDTELRNRLLRRLQNLDHQP